MILKRLKKFANEKYGKRVKELLRSKDELSAILLRASTIIKKKEIPEKFENAYKDFLTLLRLLKAYAKREYSEVSWRSLWLSVLGVVYFVTVVDFVPDFILGLGLVDDFMLITWIISSIKADIDKFGRHEEEVNLKSTLKTET